jgi:hypothetical protein
MRTPSEFQKTFWSGFNNSDLGNDLEKHLTNIKDTNEIRLYYGRDRSTPNIHNEYYIDINTTAYTYANVKDRNFDMTFFKKVVEEFKRENNLPKSEKLIWIS